MDRKRIKFAYSLYKLLGKIINRILAPVDRIFNKLVENIEKIKKEESKK